MADLPTNYYDDILSDSMNGKKKFRLTYRNGTTEEVTIEDISEYDQYGSKFGAGDINKTNQAVNEKLDSEDVVDPMLTTEKGFAADAFLTGKELKEQKENLTASNGMPFKFGINENGEYGHFVTDSEGADAFFPFKNLERDTAATAAAAQITEGYTAWVNGKLVVGTRPAPITVQSGSVTFMVSAAGHSGDIVYPETTTHLVTFPKTFDKTPTVKVVATSYQQYLTVTAISVNQSSFIINVVNSMVGSDNITFNWSAQA